MGKATNIEDYLFLSCAEVCKCENCLSECYLISCCVLRCCEIFIETHQRGPLKKKLHFWRLRNPSHATSIAVGACVIL